MDQIKYKFYWIAFHTYRDVLPTLNTEYESNKLQSEIANMKQMRQSYGPDWLLSAPKLQVDNVSHTTADKSNKDDSDASSIEAIDERPDEDNVLAKQKSSRATISNIIESFVVYRIIERTDICVVSLSDTCIIEKVYIFLRHTLLFQAYNTFYRRRKKFSSSKKFVTLTLLVVIYSNVQRKFAKLFKIIIIFIIFILEMYNF